jgi:hypothetical protein
MTESRRQVQTQVDEGIRPRQRMVHPMGRLLVGTWLLCAMACESRLVLVDPPPGSCNPTNCAGCCDSHNTCLAGSAQSDSQCGDHGRSCFQCTAGTQCLNGACKAPPVCANCGSGCCFGSLCQSGNEDIACGKDGQVCESCGNRQHCVDKTCTTCGPSNCTGCCDSFGRCVAGDHPDDCGRGGASCQWCGLGMCVGGACR